MRPSESRTPPTPPIVFLLQSHRSLWLLCRTRCIEGFFALCPTASALLDADPADVEVVIASLGLFDSRMRTLIELSSAFLTMPIFDVGLEKHNKIYGIGEFSVHSYRIFGLDDRACKPNDAALVGYVGWRNKHAPPKA